MPSHGVVGDAKHMNAQAHVCACQLRLGFPPPPVKRRPRLSYQLNGIEWWPSPRISWSHPYQKLRLRTSSSPLSSARPDCEDTGPLEPLPRVSSLLAWGLNSAAEWCGVPRRSRGPQQHNERGARGALAHMENVPPKLLHCRSRKATSSPMSPRKARWRVPFSGLLPGALGIRSSSRCLALVS